MYRRGLVAVVLAIASSAHARIELGLGQTQYLNPPSSLKIPNGQYDSLEASLFFEAHPQVWEFKAQAEASWGLGCTRNCSFVEAPELYAGRNFGDTFTLRAGRVRHDWSRFDSFWDLGLTEPRHRWNYLHPLHVGLTGLFSEYRVAKNLTITTFASPLYIPERGVPIDASNGNVDSASPWFLHPPREISLAGQATPVRYRLRLPALSQIVVHPSAGLEVRKDFANGFWSKASYLYKPMNQLAIGVDALFDLSALDVSVDLYPRVVYHHLVNAELGWANDSTSAWFASLIEVPVRDSTPARWTTQEFQHASAISAGVEQEAPKLWTARRPRARIGAMKAWGGNAADRSPFAMSGPSQFELRYPIALAVLVGLDLPLVGEVSQRLDLNTQFLIDVEGQASRLSVGLNYKPTTHVEAQVGADVLGGDPSKTNNYLVQYRANDRVYGKVSYEF
jgi:hypothetical protein